MKIITMVLLLTFIVVGLTVNSLVNVNHTIGKEFIDHILFFIGGMATGIFIFDDLFKKD